MSFQLPTLPTAHQDFIPYLASKPTESLRQLVRPYIEYESKLREGFAQHRDAVVLQDPAINAIPIFQGHEHYLNVRARDPSKDPEQGKYIMALKDEDRKPNGSPAMVQSLVEFRNNFNLFSEQSLVDMDWNNVVAAGSSVVTAMLPVPEEHQGSKRALREYYHQQLAPASDVDLFIWGLNEEAAIKKIQQIEDCVRNSILAETTTIRTKNAITIASQYPTRHIQIVLRLYKSVSEILTGFDVDCSCFAYDGQQVWATARGITSFCSQTNTIDLSRRSPSYESRLAKYAHRGFEVYFSELDRKRIDPTIFERSFVRTMGLARLLVLERLPRESDRDAYLNQRRLERGRPHLDLHRKRQRQLPGDMKDKDSEDIPDWDFEADISNYHTFSVPYGPKYHAKKIERLLYVKDMLLNAEWNHKKDRAVNLHRHPCFIGDAASVIHDCCGECPKPTTDEELKVAEQERKIYVHGNIEFMKDDPGRQAIGSFNPLTANDWTDMAYVGNTQVLSEAITNGDIDFVHEWCATEGNDVNRRDHTGRMPLHLAVLCGQLEITRCLIDHGARIVSRIADGFTALHIAAALGRADIIKVLAEKSDANEELEAESDKRQAAARKAARDQTDTQMTDANEANDDDEDMIDDEDEPDDDMTQGSFVKVKENGEKADIEATLEEDALGPDIYDINVLAWDAPVSPLHVAILGAHTDCIEILVSSFGADILLPVKLRSAYNNDVNEAILTLVLAAKLRFADSPVVVQKLIQLGAKPSQSDVMMISALHGSVILENVCAVKAMFEHDLPSSRLALDHVAVLGGYWNTSVDSPLLSAIDSGNEALTDMLLEKGAQAVITFEVFREAYLRVTEEERQRSGHSFIADEKELQKKFRTSFDQPIIEAAKQGMPPIILRLIDMGANINSEDTTGAKILMENWTHTVGNTVLDHLDIKINQLVQLLSGPVQRIVPDFEDGDRYMQDLKPGGYEYTMVSRDLELARMTAEALRQDGAKEMEEFNSEEKRSERAKLEKQIQELRETRQILVDRGAKSFYDIHTNFTKPIQQALPMRGRHGTSSNDEMNKERLKRYEIEHTFKDPRIMPRSRLACLKLFNAAWEGDIDTVKALTLKPIEDGSGEALNPLSITTADSFNMTPLGIALGRGHGQLAKTIIDIAHAQYKPDEKKQPQRRFRILNTEDSDADSVTNDDHAIPIQSEIVNEDYTIDDLGQLSKTVGSDISVAALLVQAPPIWSLSAGSVHEAQRSFRPHWKLETWLYNKWEAPEVTLSKSVKWAWGGTGLLEFAYVRNDLSTLKFILNSAKDAGLDPTVAKALTWRADSGAVWTRNVTDVLRRSLEDGNVPFAEELIIHHGAGLPLDQMVSSIKIPEDETEKPKYYQGLKVHGRHKKDWAKQASGDRREAADWRTQDPPPFLLSVYNQKLRAIEFWQSDAAIRLYEQYGKLHTHDKRVHLLAKSAGSWNAVVEQWLSLRRNLALHCAVLRNGAKNDDPDVMQYILRTVPESLGTKSSGGHDPLWLAFHQHKVEAARLLIEAGADQTTRDNTGLNILHAMLENYHGDREEAVPRMESLIKLIDPRILSGLFVERCSVEPTGLTPFVYWLQRGHSEEQRTFSMLEKYMPEDVYTRFDGSGQTPVHKLVMQHGHKLAAQILANRPHLLALENAAGQTPLDLAYALFLRSQTASAPRSTQREYSHVSHIARRPKIANQQPKQVLTKEEETYYALLEMVPGKHAPLKRKIISVGDASELAKRLADKQLTAQEAKPRVTRRMRRRGYWEESGNGDEVHDEVKRWFER